MGILIRFIKSLTSKRTSNTTPEIKPKVVSKSGAEKERSFVKLRKDGGSYYITSSIPYKADHFLKTETVEKVLSFAYGMTFGNEGAHRDHRSGGTYMRKNGEIFANTFQGKLAECATCNFFYQLGYVTKPDFSRYELGKWDSVDLSVGGKEISIKSTKSFGQLLLLETKDWDAKGRYIPNVDKGDCYYDAFIFIRLDPSCEDILKRFRLLYTDQAEYDDLKKVLLSQSWSYQCVGFITRADLQYIIRNKYILPKGSMLNGTTMMDADNFYIQTGDLRPMNELADILHN